MTWYRSISGFEVFFIVGFIIIYLAYLYRLYLIGRILKSNPRAVISKLILRSGYLILLIIALLGPSFGDTTREVKSVGKDILICVDLSESMNAFDIQPTRLEKVKFELKNIVDAFNTDRIGLIIFSSEAFVQSPLTYDQTALSMFIDVLNTNLVPNTGTDFAPSLQMALEKLTSEESNVIEQKSKIIILISDGEDFGDNTSAIATKIAENNLKLYTLGVGTRAGGRIRTSYGFKTDRTGQVVISKLKDRDLKSLAVKTGGKYFEINEDSNDIERMINHISQIEGELRDAKRVDVSANKYYYFVALALILICLDIIVNGRTVHV